MGEQSVRYQFFKHYFNARQDEKIGRLQRKEAMEGYGIFWALLEHLGTKADHRAKCDYDDLAFMFHADAVKIKRVVEEYDLFEIENGYFYSRSFTKQMDEARESYQRRAAAGSQGGKRKALNKQNDSNATATPKQNDSYKNRIEENRIEENRIDNEDDISSSPTVESDTRLVASNSNDATTRHFDNRIDDKKYIAIVRAFMYRGAAHPSAEATQLIDMMSSSKWISFRGENFTGREEDAVGLWTVPRERKYIDGHRCAVGECRMIDWWLNVLQYSGIYDIYMLDCFRGASFDTKTGKLILMVSNRKDAKYIEDMYIVAMAMIIRDSFDGFKSMEYQIRKDNA